ncbi:hypothetical protein DIPPA_14821 [Diplonema papillatum]|nr:hypothetical protein DIPPA_14821 [Diplonema papillatum]|eukprot:gene7571-11597_t
MSRQWAEFPDSSMGKMKPAARSSLYASLHQARAFAVAVGYTAVAMPDGGEECLFYRGTTESLLRSRKKTKGCTLLIRASSNGGQGGEEGGVVRDGDEWEFVEGEVTAEVARCLEKAQDIVRRDQLTREEEDGGADENAEPWGNGPDAGGPQSGAELYPRDECSCQTDSGRTVYMWEYELWYPFVGWRAPFFSSSYHFVGEDGVSMPSPYNDQVDETFAFLLPPNTRWSGEWVVCSSFPPKPTASAAPPASSSSSSRGDPTWLYSMDFRYFHSSRGLLRKRRWKRTFVPIDT